MYAADGPLTMAYYQAGVGPPLLLLHGLGGSADVWQPLMADLTPHFTVIAPDLLGFGFSDKPSHGHYTPVEHTTALQVILQATGTTALQAVVAHSCGGVIAMTLLAAGGVTAQRLVLAASAYPTPRFPVRNELLRSPLDRAMLGWRPLAHGVHRVLTRSWPLVLRVAAPPALRGVWVGYMDHTLTSYVRTAEQCLFQANLDPILPRLRHLPTFLLYGARDQTVPMSHGARLAAALPRSRLHVVPGDHYAVLQAGRALVENWLRAPLPTD
jgi:pimeloyl-ACP methyl ester carboxylesterase